MTGAEAITEFERKLVSVRTIAAQTNALEQYQRDVLPPGPVPPLLEQGFAAGFDAAMSAVRSALVEVQSTVLREGQAVG